MTFVDMVNIIHQVTYKPGWSISVHEGFESVGPYLQVTFPHGDSIQNGRKWKLSYHMTKSELVRTAFKACLTAEEHEAREAFLYDDEPIFGPHIDVDALKYVAKNHDRRLPFLPDDPESGRYGGVGQSR